MLKGNFRRLVSLVLACMLVLSLCSVGYATEIQKTEAMCEATNGAVRFGNGFIQEEVTMGTDSSPVHIVRTSYNNNTSVTHITENGVTTVIPGTVNYALLRGYLDTSRTVSAYDRASGYEYIYMKTEESTEYFTPENAKYSTIFAAVSLALSGISPPLSTLSAIASMILDASSAPNETKVTTTSTWYFKHEKATGEFICYYVECSADTYVKNSDDDWVYLGSESWDYEALSV